MTVNISSVHFHADDKLRSFISEKLKKLSKFYDKIISVEVFLKLENAGQVKDKIVELKANIPGAVLISTSVEKSFEASFDDAQESIIKQLKKRKSKMEEAKM